MRQNYFFLLFLLFSFGEMNFSFASDTVSIRDAIDKGIISAIVKNTGGHSDECIEITIENKLGEDMILSIEAGRKMISEDTAMQDIMVTRQYAFLLSKTEKAKLKLFGMCIRAHRRSPAKDSKFSVGKMADSLLVQLARFIDKFNYRNGTSQNAVWVLSDGNSLESVYSESNDATGKKLLEFMHILTKKPFPWYTLEYQKDTVILFTGKPKTLHGYYNYFVQNNSVVTIGIYKEDGHLQAILFSQRTHNPGKYDYPFTLDVSKWKKGNYFLKFYVDDQVKEKKLITL